MKTNCILLGLLLLPMLAQSQPPAARLQPNSNAEADIRLVTTYLNHLAKGHIEAAGQLLAADFKSIGPGYSDTSDRDQILQSCAYNQRLFADQQYVIQDSSSVVCVSGDDQGVWVYHQGVWNARDNRTENLWPLSKPFHNLARVKDGKIVENRITFVNDQIFYDLGFLVYKDVTQRVAMPKKQKIRQ
jgi:ketosteroid isomerase-like protein